MMKHSLIMDLFDIFIYLYSILGNFYEMNKFKNKNLNKNEYVIFVVLNYYEIFLYFLTFHGKNFMVSVYFL